jgi:hypothetical protein
VRVGREHGGKLREHLVDSGQGTQLLGIVHEFDGT